MKTFHKIITIDFDVVPTYMYSNIITVHRIRRSMIGNVWCTYLYNFADGGWENTEKKSNKKKKIKNDRLPAYLYGCRKIYARVIWICIICKFDFGLRSRLFLVRTYIIYDDEDVDDVTLKIDTQHIHTTRTYIISLNSHTLIAYDGYIVYTLYLYIYYIIYLYICPINILCTIQYKILFYPLAE